MMMTRKTKILQEKFKMEDLKRNCSDLRKNQQLTMNHLAVKIESYMKCISTYRGRAGREPTDVRLATSFRMVFHASLMFAATPFLTH